MPHVYLYKGEVDFSKGRHGFAWARDHSVKALPVTTDQEERAEMKGKFSTRSRQSVIKKRVFKSR